MKILDFWMIKNSHSQALFRRRHSRLEFSAGCKQLLNRKELLKLLELLVLLLFYLFSTRKNHNKNEITCKQYLQMQGNCAASLNPSLFLFLQSYSRAARPILIVRNFSRLSRIKHACGMSRESHCRIFQQPRFAWFLWPIGSIHRKCLLLYFWLELKSVSFLLNWTCSTRDVRSVSHDVSRDVTRDHHLMNLQTRSIDDTDTSARDTKKIIQSMIRHVSSSFVSKIISVT